MKTNVNFEVYSLVNNNNDATIVAKINLPKLLDEIKDEIESEFNNADVSLIISSCNKINFKRLVKNKNDIFERDGKKSRCSIFNSFTILLRSNNVGKQYNDIITKGLNRKKGFRKRGFKGGKPQREDIKDADFVEHPGAKKALDDQLKRVNKNDPRNKNIDDWNANDFLKYMAIRFEDTYGMQTLELKSFISREARGKKYALVNNSIVKFFAKNGYDKNHVREYIDWLFNEKSGKMMIHFGLVKSPIMIQEWMLNKKGKKNKKSFRDKFREV